MLHITQHGISKLCNLTSLNVYNNDNIYDVNHLTLLNILNISWNF